MRFPKIKTLIIASVFTVVLVLVNLTGFSKTVKEFFYSRSAALQSVFWNAGSKVNDFKTAVLNAKNLQEENKKLNSQNQELLAQALFLKETQSENEFLRKAMDLELAKEFNLILARAVGKDILRDSILINKGFKDGIKKGRPAITGQKALLGKVGEVFENFSEIILISNPDSSFDAKISGTDIFGVIKGKSRLGMDMEFISKEKELVSGSFVVSAALGGIFPEGLLVGKTAEVKKSDAEPFQSAKIEPAFDIKELDRLFIIGDFASRP